MDVPCMSSSCDVFARETNSSADPIGRPPADASLTKVSSVPSCLIASLAALCQKRCPSWQTSEGLVGVESAAPFSRIKRRIFRYVLAASTTSTDPEVSSRLAASNPSESECAATTLVTRIVSRRRLLPRRLVVGQVDAAHLTTASRGVRSTAKCGCPSPVILATTASDAGLSHFILPGWSWGRMVTFKSFKAASSTTFRYML
mmetsp:Transcript_50140/g.141606  ORF Transcript_50140/g.141606 Transcript_50140/m.141606 type:complete len:202 (+) Transcript_50140:317-922(+)